MDCGIWGSPQIKVIYHYTMTFFRNDIMDKKTE